MSIKKQFIKFVKENAYADLMIFGIVLIMFAIILKNIDVHLLDIQFLNTFILSAGIVSLSEGVLIHADFNYDWVFMLIIPIPFILYAIHLFSPALFREIMFWLLILTLIIVGSLLAIAIYLDEKDF